MGGAAMKKNLFLLFFSVATALFILEISLRILGFDSPKKSNVPKTDWALVPERIWTEYDPQLGWTHQKSKRAVLRINGEREVALHTNSVGLRGSREYEKEKKPGVKRVLALGDSFVFGWGVFDHETLAAKLEQRNPDLEVPNFGVPGYGIDQILMRFRTLGKDYKSDYVLISIFPEDFWRATRSFADTGHAKPYFSLSAKGELQLHNVPVPPPFSLTTNQFPELIDRNFLEDILMASVLYRQLKRGILRLGKKLGWVDPESSDEWIVGRAILRQLISEVAQTGAWPVLVLIPPDRWIINERKEALYRSLLKFCGREKIECLDLTPVFRQAVQAYSLSDYYFPRDNHWTEKGHQLAADVITQYLRRDGFSLN